MKAFQKIVEHYRQSVYNICILMIGNEEKAEELASDTFLYAHAHMNDFLKSNKRFSIWLYQSMVILAQERLKEGLNLDEVTSAKGILPLLLNVPFNKRVAIIMDAWYHLSDQEISEVLHTTKSEVQTFIYEGREKFSEVLRCMDSVEKENLLRRIG